VVMWSARGRGGLGLLEAPALALRLCTSSTVLCRTLDRGSLGGGCFV